LARRFTPSENNGSDIGRECPAETFVANWGSTSDTLTGQVVSKVPINCLAVLIRVVPLTDASVPSDRPFCKP
jgi:hypothetical protein